MASQGSEGTAVPNPGSDEAMAIGCTCPRMDNGYGRGAFGGVIFDTTGKPSFWIDDDCPLHSSAASEANDGE